MRQQTNVTELFGPVSQPAPDLPTRRKLNITTLGQLARDAKAPEFMINNILETQSHGMMIGDSESFKSFLLLHLASCITTSKPFLGNNVYTTGKVLYICGEGKGGIGRRGRGIAGQTENDNILVVDEYITMKSETALAGIADIVREHDIKLVMIDTYSSLSGSDDEQSNSEVANILQQVRTACGNASSIVSHHFGKDKSKGARGASAFRANADFVWMVERDKDHPFEGRIICDKMKDADHFKDQFFIAKQVPLFGLIRQDETMATTLVIEEFMPSEKEPEEFDHYTHSLITTKESLKQELKLNDAAMENLLTNHYLQAFLTIIGDKKDYTSVLADVRSRTNTKAPPTPNLSEESRRKAINRLILKFIDFGLLVYSKDLKSIIITHKGETVIGLINELWRLENDDVFSRTFLFDESHTDTSSGTPYHSPIPHNSVDLPDWITG